MKCQNKMYLKGGVIKSKRFYLRELDDDDANSDYLKWVSDLSNEYIVTKDSNYSIQKLKEYIKEKQFNKESLLLGIFTNDNNKHIGNIKYEPINSIKGLAVMGILIGNIGWRGKGVASEVIRSSSLYLHSSSNINKILLGVNIDNVNAIRAYDKIGFIVKDKAKSKEGVIINMELDILGLNILNQPIIDKLKDKKIE